MSSTPNDFDAAKTISDLLKDMEKDRQQRILRWVAESLDITLHVRMAPPHDGAVGGAPDSAVGVAMTPPSHLLCEPPT